MHYYNSYRGFKGLPVLLVLMALCLPGMADAAVRLTAKLDSVALTQGSRAGLTLSVTGASVNGTLLPDLKPLSPIGEGVEISDVSVDTTDMGGGLFTLDYNMHIQAFDPGNITIPPFVYITENGDSVFSNPLVLKVMEVDLDTLTTINPIAPTLAVESRWYDWIPDWWIWVALGLGIVMLGLALYFFLRKDKVVVIKRVKKVIPPYELAISRLNALQSKNLVAKGSEKEYYTELTEILRQYLEGRFGINAMEMTSTQIIATLSHNEETRPGSPLVKEVLNVADFVKFAKVRPLPDDNIKSFNSAKKFVEDTKPVEPVSPEGNSTDSKGDIHSHDDK